MKPHTLISVAPNGARRMKSDHPALPITPEEIAQTAHACAQAGAGLIHVHVRDNAGRHSLDPARYRDAISAVRAAAGPDLIIQITTESAGVFGKAEQIRVVEALRPEACSVALRELCPSDAPEDVDAYARFLADCRSEDVWVQHILYDEADITRFNRFRADGLYGASTPFVLIVLGRYRDGKTVPPLHIARHALALGTGTSEPPPDWAVCAFGSSETRLTAGAAALGGHVRVGFENNLQRADGSLAESNAERVADCVRALQALDLSPMPASQARAVWRVTGG